jgi:hypothetical protein
MPKETIDYEYWNDIIVDELIKRKGMSYEEALESATNIWDNIFEIVRKAFPRTRFNHIDVTLEITGKHAKKAKEQMLSILRNWCVEQCGKTEFEPIEED